jgi:hypothetical protein
MVCAKNKNKQQQKAAENNTSVKNFLWKVYS